MNLKNFYSGKRILVTGHTGFKGAWLCLVLHQMGANVKGISLPPDDRRGNFYKILKLIPPEFEHQFFKNIEPKYKQMIYDLYKNKEEKNNA